MKSGKKNGFTLIELLITIALMLSLLGISIVSFISISNRKKQQAYNVVKEQIITAAEQYFTSNEYLFEGLDDKTTGIISLGKLVNEDYLNVVTDPRTGKKLNKCSYVEVTKNGRKFSSEFINNEEERKCDNDNSLVLSEPGAPYLSIHMDPEGKGHYNKETDWWYKNGYNIAAEVNTNGNGQITNVYESTTCDVNTTINKATSVEFQTNASYNKYTDKTGSKFKINTISTDTQKTGLAYVAVNASGKKTIQCVEYNLDKTPPTAEVVATANGKSVVGNWSNANIINYGFKNVSDKLSGIKSVVNYWNKSKNTRDVSDSDDYKWSDSKVNYPSGGSAPVYNVPNPAKASLTLKDRTDFSMQEEGWRKYSVRVCDVAGNCTREVVAFGIDRTAPNAQVVATANTTSGASVVGNWSNANLIRYGFKNVSDNLSGIKSVVNYWNKSGNTRDVSDSNDYKWSDSKVNYPSGGSDSVYEVSDPAKASLTLKNNTNYTNFPMQDEGWRKYSVRVCDLAGNCTREAVAFGIDRTKPTCQISVTSGSKSNGNYYGDVKLGITGTDDNSGVDDVYFSNIRGTSLTINSSRNVPGYVVDAAGNSNTCEEYFSFVPPINCNDFTINATKSADGYDGWYKDRNGVSFNITAPSGVTWYWITNGKNTGENVFTIGNDWYTNWGSNTGNKTKKITGNGERTVAVGYKENGNLKTCKLTTVKLDNTAPTFNLDSIKMIQYNNEGSVIQKNTFYTSGKTVTLQNVRGELEASGTYSNLNDTGGSGIDMEYSYWKFDFNGYESCYDHHPDTKECHCGSSGYAPCNNSKVIFHAEDKAGNVTEKYMTFSAKYKNTTCSKKCYGE